MKGKLIILSGPSGVGKSTIRTELIKQLPNLWYSISATTRPKRDNEQNGIDYYFLTKEEFVKQIENNNFLEYEEVYKDTYYGTLKQTVFDKLNNNINVILEIDVNGALNIKKNLKEAILIFIEPPSFENLKTRLINRDTESEEKLKERLEKASYELSKKHHYDYIVTNDDLTTTISKVKEIIANEINN